MVISSRAQVLVEGYEKNSGLIHRHAEGLTDAGCFRQPAFEAISFNWVLGHIVAHRNIALQALGATSIWPENLDHLYRRDPAGVTATTSHVALAQLLTDLDAAGERLAGILKMATDAFLDEVVDYHTGVKARQAHMRLYQWHETYHVGQLGILRSLAARERKG